MRTIESSGGEVTKNDLTPANLYDLTNLDLGTHYSSEYLQDNVPDEIQ